MNIKIIGVGKLKEKYLKDGIAEYTKRLHKFAKVEIIEVPDEKAPEQLSQAQMDQVMSKEGERILNKIKDKEKYIIVQRYMIGRTQTELAEEIGISQAQISHLEKNGLAKIKKLIK